MLKKILSTAIETILVFILILKFIIILTEKNNLLTMSVVSVDFIDVT